MTLRAFATTAVLAALLAAPLTAQAAPTSGPLRAVQGSFAAATPQSLDSYGDVRPVDIVVNVSNLRDYEQPTNAQIEDVIETASAYWATNTYGAIGGFSVRSITRYSSALTCDASDSAWAADAATHSGQGLAASDYIGPPAVGTPAHLLVLGSCQYSLNPATATMGDGLGSGGWTVFVDDAFSSPAGFFGFDDSLIHELGHNLGLEHAGAVSDWDCDYLDEPMFTAVEKCGFSEYGDYMSPMGAGSVEDNGEFNETPLLDAYRRDLLGVMPAGTVATKTGTGATTYTLGTLGVGTGTQAIHVTGPTSGQEYYLEYRAGVGEETVYQFAYPDSAIVRVTEVHDDGTSEWAPVRLNGVDTRLDYGLKAKGAWSNAAGDVHVTVTSAGSTSASVTVTTGPVSRVAITGVALTGVPAVGSPVSAVVTGLAPSNATLTYQWFRGLELIEGATSASYTPTAEDVGTSLRVQVIARASGYYPTAAVSPTVDGYVRTSLPAIVGTAKPDRTLTAVPGAGVPAGATVTYQWLRDGVEIPDATERTYVVATADGGAKLSVRVTATWSGGSLTQVSPETIEVATHAFLLVGEIGVDGEAVVGQTITLTLPEELVLPAPTTIAVTWYCSGTQVGTGLTYTVRVEDSGCALEGVVRATRTAYEPYEIYAVSAAVTGGQINWRAPSIPTAIKVGTTVTADPGGWWNGLWLTYQWYRNSSPIPGATAQTYKTTASDAGATLSVRVRGADENVGDKTVFSNAVTVGYATLTSATPTISGSAKVGSTVTAIVGTWTSGTSFTYRWYANGVAISGATGKSYKVPSTLVGKKLSVKVTGKKTGYTTKTVSSASIAVPRVGKPYLSGTAKVGRTLYAKTGTWTSGTTFTYQWYVNGVAVSGATKSKIVLKSSWAGKTVKAKVTGKKSGYTTVSVYTASSAKVKR
ncbi:hypothetical protein [Demequina sp.]|uniref:hypothetical protein n=1 Tax=Demequina sp. TaxID=2050685 RepID=UPI003D1091E4